MDQTKRDRLMQRYAEAGGRRIVASGGKVQKVTLSKKELAWAEREGGIPVGDTSEVIGAFNRFWHVTVEGDTVTVSTLGA